MRGVMSFVDPFDQQALNVLEDKLGIHCSCACGGDPQYCDIHNGSRLIDTLNRVQLFSQYEVDQKVEEALHKMEDEEAQKENRRNKLLQEAVDAFNASSTDDAPDESWWTEWKIKAEAILEEV